MVVLRSLCAGSLILAASSLLACSSSDDGKEEKDMQPTAGSSGSMSLPPLDVGNAAGSTAMPAATAGSPASPSGASGASGASASAGSSGSSGSSSSAAGASGSDAAGQGGSGMPAEDDPFAGLFDPGPTSCEGFLCLDAADCASLYPDENTTCKFTSCVDFSCK